MNNQLPGVAVMGDLNKLSAFEAVNGIKNNEFTSEELIVDCIERIEEREPYVRAWAHFDANTPHYE